MKLAVSALLVSSVAGFSMDMTFSLGKKKAAAPKKAVGGGPSTALPWTTAPSSLDGSLVGDFGFDPLNFSGQPLGGLQPLPFYIPSDSFGLKDDLTFYREAELMHGRIAQLAVLGFLWPGFFGTFPGNDWTGSDAYSYTNPLEELTHVPGLALAQIVTFMLFLEFRRVQLIREQGPNYVPGDNNIGVPGGFNPFGFEYDAEEYELMRLREIKHCRLAMIGFLGVSLQALNSGESVADQLGRAFVVPEYAAKAGYFLPEGI
jgi:light-harvesting complex I chlorophyll a/b binding protein 1